MNPFRGITHLLSGWLDNFSFFWGIIFNFSGALWNKSMERSCAKCGGCINSCNLCSQIYRFLFKVEWICEYSSFDISREIELNLSSLLYLRWFDIWKLYPVFKKTITHPINIFISTSTSGLESCFLSLTLFFIITSFFTSTI